VTGTVAATTVTGTGSKEYVTATTRRWKVSLVQDHENVAVNGVVEHERWHCCRIM
jgi:hypothetical protein